MVRGQRGPACGRLFICDGVEHPLHAARQTNTHWINTISSLAILPFVLIPIVVGIAILKYRLYDIDVVIKKTVVFGALAAFITSRLRGHRGRDRALIGYG